MSIGISNDVAFWSTIALGSIVNYLVLTTLNAKVDECDISPNLKSHGSSNIGIRNNIAMITTIINSKERGEIKATHISIRNMVLTRWKLIQMMNLNLTPPTGLLSRIILRLLL